MQTKGDIEEENIRKVVLVDGMIVINMLYTKPQNVVTVKHK